MTDEQTDLSYMHRRNDEYTQSEKDHQAAKKIEFAWMRETSRGLRMTLAEYQKRHNDP